MTRKRLPPQKEALFETDSLEESPVEPNEPIGHEEIRKTDEKDLELLGEITDAAKDDADLEEVIQLGASALPDEVQVVEIEDIETQESMTDEEYKRIEGIVNQRKLSRRQAEAIVLGEERAAKLNGEDELKASTNKKKDGSSNPERNPYAGSSKGKKHPVKISPRVRTSGDANSGDPHLR
jgi:hypothetical protein